VHDTEGTFAERVNYEMVDLDPLDDTDREWLHQRVQRHFDETESVVAARLLDRWGTWVEQFRKVMPKDYKRVLEAQRVAEERGEDVIDAIMAASRG
jgi:glutamate synthase (NADPH/NADH) large chain